MYQSKCQALSRYKIAIQLTRVLPFTLFCNCWQFAKSWLCNFSTITKQSKGHNMCWLDDNLMYAWCDVWIRVWHSYGFWYGHSYGFWYERISEYIRDKKMTRTNIRIYSYDFFLHEQISEYIRIKILIRTNIRINIRIENIQIYLSHSGLDWHQLCAITI